MHAILLGRHILRSILLNMKCNYASNKIPITSFNIVYLLSNDKTTLIIVQ